jgi:hypothetical protein
MVMSSPSTSDAIIIFSVFDISEDRMPTKISAESLPKNPIGPE